MYDPLTGIDLPDVPDYLPAYATTPTSAPLSTAQPAPPPAGSPAPGSGPAASPYTLASGLTSQFANAFYPGVSVVDGKLVGGNIAPNGQNGAAEFLNSLWDPYSKGDYQKFFETYRGPNAAANPTDLKSLLGPLSSLGWHGNPNAAGEITDFTLPNGDIVDPLLRGGAGGWQWLVNPKGGGTTGPTPAATALAGRLGPLTEPWNEAFTPPAWTTGPYESPAIPEYPNFAAPEAFKAPTAEDLYADPSFKLRENEGANMLENSAWAQGRGREGGFLKDLLKYGQEFASTEYGNVYGRKASEFDRNYSNLLNAYTTNRDTTLGKYGLQKSSYDSLYGAKRQASQDAYQQYLDREAAFRANQNGAYSKLFGVTQLGASVA